MERDPEYFTSGEVTIEATIEHCRFSWPVSADDLVQECESGPTFDNVSEEILEYLDYFSLSWKRCDITAEASLEGITFSASCSIDIPLAKGIRKEMAKEKGREQVDADIEGLPDALVSALEEDGTNVGFNHDAVEDVYPSVSAEWVGRKIRVTVEVDTTLRAWTDSFPDIEESIVSECDFSQVPDHLRQLLGVSGDSVPWDSLDVVDETDDSGLGYSATATVCLSLKGPLSEEDEETLRDTLQENYSTLLADLGSAEYECDDGGSVTVDVEQEFDEPEEEEEEEDEDEEEDEEDDDEEEEEEEDDDEDQEEDE